MDGVRKLIEKLDMVPEGKELSLRQQITLVLWGLTIVLLPFLRFPYGPFAKLSFYPILAITFLNIDKWWNLCWKNKYLRYTGLAIGAYIVWQLISLPFAVKLSEISFGENIRPIINDVMTYGAWYVFLAACFLIPKEKIRQTFYWGLTITLLYCSVYSVIEILHWSKVQWATDFLAKAIYFIQQDVGQSHGWWPPVFWDSPRLRSVFAEPSYFSVLLSFSLLYYVFCAWFAEKWLKIAGNICLAVLALFLLCGTKSASGTLALSGSMVLFVILFTVFFRKLTPVQKKKGIACTILLLSFSALVGLNQRGGIKDFLVLKEKLTSSINKKVPPKESHFKSSSGTRLIHLKSELKMIAENPFAGCGSGEYGEAMKKTLKNNPEKTREIRLWSENEEYVPPSLNIYTKAAVQNGLIGLIFFCLMFLPAFVCCIKSLKTLKPEIWIALIVLCGVIVLTFCTAATNSLYYFCLLAFPFYCISEKIFPGKNKT